jgi:hypothetical protein
MGIVHMKKVPNCRRCATRDICQAPCEALKRSLDKKFPQAGKEFNIGIPTYLKEPWPDPLPRKKYSRQDVVNRDRVLVTLDSLGFPRDAISQVLNITKKNVRQRVYMARRRLGLV